MRTPLLIFLCNAIDEMTCKQRGITSDSPAETQKVLQVSRALKSAGAPTLVLSLGRGRQHGSGKYFPAKVKRVGGIPVLYAPFLDRPGLTHLSSLFGLVPLIFRLRKHRPKPTVLVYNRLPHYWLSMEIASKLGFRLFLDIEDGRIAGQGSKTRQFISYLMTRCFDRLCPHGAVLSSSAVASQYAGQRTTCCYGVTAANGDRAQHIPQQGPLVLHMGGTLQESTGSSLLAAAIRHLRTMPNPPDVRFVVTGMGSGAAELEALSKEDALPSVTFLGKVSRETYLKVLNEVHVGLSLRLPSCDYTDTTFPSKVIEIAANGMLLLSTRTSDVPKIFQTDGAVFIDRDTPETLADAIVQISGQRAPLPEIARRGQQYAHNICSKEQVGKNLKAFIFGSQPSDERA